MKNLYPIIMLFASTNAYSDQDEKCLSEAIVTAWENAGGSPIWMVQDIVMHNVFNSEGRKQAPDDLPGFFSILGIIT